VPELVHLRGKGTGAPFDPPREFVAVGPYRFVRNPMYIGGWLMFAGLGFYVHSVSILLCSFLWFLVAHFFVIFYEEPTLEKKFGKSYLDYKKSVNRWIPKVG
jgi:protein-S-isoprenylcysteine O-methyltransferase Ste14